MKFNCFILILLNIFVSSIIFVSILLLDFFNKYQSTLTLQLKILDVVFMSYIYNSKISYDNIILPVLCSGFLQLGGCIYNRYPSFFNNFNDFSTKSHHNSLL